MFVVFVFGPEDLWPAGNILQKPLEAACPKDN